MKTTTASSSSFRLIVFEVLSIFLAVFLAFGVSEWREVRKNKALAATALAGMVDEINRNKHLIEQMLPSHERVRNYSRQGGDVAQMSTDSLTFLPIILRGTAWRTASETGAMIHMEYKQATALAEVYTFQEAYNKLTENMMSSSFSINNYGADKEDAQLAVLQWISFVFVENERMLLQAYEKTLTALGEDPAVRVE
ncbi:MAG: hypothetical protein AAF564_00780 [Bacteroidota bacterium]